MIKYLKYFFIASMLAGCAATPTKHQINTSNGDTPPGTLLEDTASSDQESSAAVAAPAPAPSIQKDTSALEAKFQVAVNSTREDLLIQIGSEILAQKPEDAKTLNGFAQFYIRANQPDLAKIFLNRVTAKDPKNANANNSLGVIAMKAGKDADAQVFFKRALAGDENHPEANANLGTYYLRYLDYDKAAIFLQRAYEHDHKNIATANNYAVALRGTGQYDDAMAIYKSIESKSKIQVLLNEAILLSEYKKDFKEAKDILNKIKFISSDPMIIKKVNLLMAQMGQ